MLVSPIDNNKPVCSINSSKPIRRANSSYLILFFILLLFRVAVNTRVLDINIHYLNIIMTIHIAYLIVTKFYKRFSIILIDCFIFIAGIRVVSRIWMQLWVFAYTVFWASGDNLDLKRPAKSYQRVFFAAEIQKKPKRCISLKIVKGP